MNRSAACSVPLCEKHKHHGSMCSMHSERLRKTGTTDAKPRPTADARFWSKVEVTGFCWTWIGAISDTGYGSFNQGNREGNIGSHRWSYEHMMGPIPSGTVIDHLCRNRSCVNPDHLEAVPEATNIRRGMAPAHIYRRTETCKRGHTLLDALIAHRRDGRITRRCRTCYKERLIA